MGVELLGLGDVGPEGCCIQQLHGVGALGGVARLVDAQHMVAQRSVLQGKGEKRAVMLLLARSWEQERAGGRLEHHT